jgi:hypothetical protein
MATRTQLKLNGDRIVPPLTEQGFRELLSRIEIHNAGTLHVPDETGDSRIQWDQSDPEQVAKAEAKFNELKALGYLAYKVNKRGDRGEVIDKFDPTAERTIMHSAVVGG